MQPLGVSSELGRDQFMRLLVTQMRNQNPLDPINDAEFVAQLAQFSSLEGIEKLNTSFSDMLRLQELTQGAGLVGRRVLFERADSSFLGRGVVDAIQVQDGKMQLLVGQELVQLDQVRGLAG